MAFAPLALKTSLIIEDAEDVLRDREGSHDSTAVSNILNLKSKQAFISDSGSVN